MHRPQDACVHAFVGWEQNLIALQPLERFREIELPQGLLVDIGTAACRRWLAANDVLCSCNTLTLNF